MPITIDIISLLKTFSSLFLSFFVLSVSLSLFRLQHRNQVRPLNVLSFEADVSIFPSQTHLQCDLVVLIIVYWQQGDHVRCCEMLLQEPSALFLHTALKLYHSNAYLSGDKNALALCFCLLMFLIVEKVTVKRDVFSSFSEKRLNNVAWRHLWKWANQCFHSQTWTSKVTSLNKK